jgi:DNA polymerase III delta prime subunit
MVVIDDIDNINEQSQQVFRNYIDKYKHNVFFLSVCTNIQKVIESIQSRVHILQITLPTNEQIRAIMDKIIANENIVIDEPAKDHLLLSSGTTIRILINYLEKITILDRPMTLDLCKKVCSNISYQKFEEYLGKLMEGNLSESIHILYSIYDYGYSVIDILDYFFIFIKLTKLLDENIKYKVIPFLCKYITIFHNVHEDCIELALFTNNIIDLFANA